MLALAWSLDSGSRPASSSRNRSGIAYREAYLLRLKTENLLQNHLLEAGARIDRPYEQMHQGWESPHCQLRGHFAGHWLSAAARFAATDGWSGCVPCTATSSPASGGAAER